jgi:hypothetical protein
MLTFRQWCHLGTSDSIVWTVFAWKLSQQINVANTRAALDMDWGLDVARPLEDHINGNVRTGEGGI